ncbi:hypothetical protein QBC45DRAFT_452487 [Copromyces sp. CBS 386.78]|nr:hypothetical protein QBC45DRAFT_452487 [Copromyces sp. CBS 386.78]
MGLNFFSLGNASLALHPETPNAGSPLTGPYALPLWYPCITFEIVETHDPQTTLRPFRPPAAQSMMQCGTDSTVRERLYRKLG